MVRVMVAVVLAAWLGNPAHGQPAAGAAPGQAKLEFEVATVKRSAAPGRGPIRLGAQGGPGRGDPSRVAYRSSTIPDLVADAYGIKRNQISGGPGWLDLERFDIVARIPAGTTREQVKVMLQNLLAARFQLTLHRETKEMPVYALVVGGKGPKLKGSADVEMPESGASEAGPPALRGMKMGRDGCPEKAPTAAGRGSFVMMTPKGECMISNGQTMEGFAGQLSGRFDRPVVDRTGLQGTYEVRLRYDPSSLPEGRGGPAMAKDGPGQTAADGDPPSIFNALEEQLGLKLEGRKGTVELLVIDHVERRPIEN